MKIAIVSLLTIVFIFLTGCCCNTAKKADNAKANLLHLKVDFAAPAGKDDPKPIASTAKEGWSNWTIPDWDFYRSNTVWEDGSQSCPQDGPGIGGSGVHAAITCHYEGIMSIHVAGMKRYLAGGVQPENKPIYEPICNTWVAGSDFPYNPTSDLIMALYDLPAGKYRLLSYHNNFNGRRIGNSPTGIEYTETREPEPPMSSIKVYPAKTVIADYFQSRAGALVKEKTYGTPEKKLLIPAKLGTGNVKQTLQAENVVIQQVKTDAELKPSTIEFTTDGSPVIVVYAGGCCKSDDLRKQRKGGWAVLNAFELIQLSAETPKQ
ncbi:MAG: hypothetical protein E4H40_04700 [Candidatus Brocadiia bacterium]|nr:MAG: hypothetical protein E4H40_04700 [Candidatus Brocadiia bacterium]